MTGAEVDVAAVISIVRDLAASDPEAAQEVTGDPMCTLCPGRSFTDDPHDPSCPWRRAREWTESHP